MRLGDKLYDSDKVLATGIYGQRRQTCLQRSNKSVVNPYTDGSGENRDKKDRIIKVQSEYTILNEVYEGTVFADIIRDVNGVVMAPIYEPILIKR